jgi:predicted RNA-binding Zn-ribbon protein involved in translation (DUF1610 family)
LAKFKPTPFSKLPATDNLPIEGLRLVVGTIISLGDQEGFFCGNCGRLILLDKKAPKPRVCSYCEQEIDWVGTKTQLAKRCPECGYETADVNSVVCPYHLPVIRLVAREIPI